MKYDDIRNPNTLSIINFEKYLEERYNNISLHLSMRTPDMIYLHSIIVNDKKQGTGTKVMSEIIDYADANNFDIFLVPAVQDKHHGTTSHKRLINFYKRFGFILNSGRKRDFSLPYGMVRYSK